MLREFLVGLGREAIIAVVVVMKLIMLIIDCGNSVIVWWIVEFR